MFSLVDEECVIAEHGLKFGHQGMILGNRLRVDLA
jgi:hypothetical protein